MTDDEFKEAVLATLLDIADLLKRESERVDRELFGARQEEENKWLRAQKEE